MIIKHAQGTVTISPAEDGKRRVVVTPRDAGLYIPFRVCETRYSDSLIQAILNAKGIPNLCDEILRDEDPNYIRQHIVTTLTAFVTPEAFVGKRLLDFGSGCGASTMVFAKQLPQTTIIGVELDRESIEIARQRAEHHGYSNIHFFQSPSGDALPADLGEFDFIFLPAVYEHLLPHERIRLSDMLWRVLKPGGILFIDETPHRWFPLETHTTGLPFINYLPDRLAGWYARTCSRYNIHQDSWDTLLRKGIRGATVREIMKTIRQVGGDPVLLPLVPGGPRNLVDVWFQGYARHAEGESGKMKRGIYWILRALYHVTGIALVPYISFAVRKR